MNKISFFLLLFSSVLTVIPAYSQKPSELRKKEKVESVNSYTIDDDCFDVFDVAEEWKNESAVILAQKGVFIYKTGLTGMYGGNQSTEVFRRRVKILDNAALEDFSEFYFIDTDQVGFQIIKPDGITIEVDISKAVVVENAIPAFFRPFFNYSDSYKKIAIPNLQIGDIIDYYYGREDSFDKHEFALASKYPIQYQRYEIKVPSTYYFLMKCYNGAPEFVGEDRGVIQGPQNFILEDSKRDKLSLERWTSVSNSEPYVRFQFLNVSLSAGYVHKMFYRSTEKSGKIPPEKIRDDYTRFLKFGRQYNNAYIFELKKLNKQIKKAKQSYSDRQIVEKAYNYIKENILFGDHREYPVFIRMNSDVFINLMMFVLDENDVKYRIVVVPASGFPNFEGIMFEDDVLYGLQLDSDKDLFVFPPSNMSSFTDIPNEVQGQAGFSYYFKYRSKDPVFKVKVPGTEMKRHGNTEKMEIDIAEDFSSASAKREVRYQGNYLTGFLEDYLNHEIILAGEKNPILKKYADNQGYAGKIPGSVFFENTENDLSSELELENYKGLDYKVEVIEDDRRELVYHDSFDILNLIDQAGNNYMLNLGYLITDQIKIEEDELERKNDIYFGYGRKFSYSFQIKIPQGYQVVGLEELNTINSNDYISYVTSAVMDDRTLKVDVFKTYKTDFASRDKWMEIVDILNQAYDFSQSKVLLRKMDPVE